MVLLSHPGAFALSRGRHSPVQPQLKRRLAVGSGALPAIVIAPPPAPLTYVPGLCDRALIWCPLHSTLAHPAEGVDVPGMDHGSSPSRMVAVLNLISLSASHSEPHNPRFLVSYFRSQAFSRSNPPAWP